MGPRASSQRQRESVGEQCSVGEARQRILEGKAAELLFERLAVGDVNEKPVRQDRVGVGRRQHARLLAEPEDLAVGADDPELLLDRLAAQVVDVDGQHPLPVVRVKQGQPQVLVGDEGLGRNARQLLHLGTEVQALEERPVRSAVSIEIDSRGQPFEQGLQTLLSLERPLGRLAFDRDLTVPVAEAVGLAQRRGEDDRDDHEPGDHRLPGQPEREHRDAERRHGDRQHRAEHRGSSQTVGARPSRRADRRGGAAVGASVPVCSMLAARVADRRSGLNCGPKGSVIRLPHRSDGARGDACARSSEKPDEGRSMPCARAWSARYAW